MARLAGKVALITGGGAGLGLAIAERLAAEGAHIVISDIAEGGAAIADERGWIFCRHDVSDERSWSDAMDLVANRHGRLDVLVNNAGIAGPQNGATPEDLRFADWKQLFAVNLDSVFLGCRAAIGRMRALREGSIVNISSIAGLRASPYAVGYGATKAAIRHLTKSVAQYCAEQGLAIRCNSVHPGSVRTALYDAWMEEAAHAKGVSVDQLRAEAAARTPLGRLVTPAEVAAAVAYLASDESRLVTGTKLIIDGGLVECDAFHASDAYLGRLRAFGDENVRQ